MNDLKRNLCNYLIKNSIVKENDVIRHSYTSSRMNGEMKDIKENNICPTLDTRCDCLGVVVNDMSVECICGVGEKRSNNGTQWYQQDRIYQGDESISVTTTCNPYYVVKENKMEKDINVIGNYSPSGHNASRIVDSKGLSPTVMENHGTVTATNDNLRIRKLTPTECFRLMAVKDEDSNKLNHLSNATKYHLAGDSIVVNVLQAIFKSILIDHPVVEQKPIRLIEFFGGYGSQSLSLKYLNIPFEHWKLCEWAINSIDAYKNIHFPNDNTDYSEILDKEDLVEYLYNKGISSNWNEPMKYESIKRKKEDELRKIYNNCKATHNLINIQQVHAKDLEMTDRDKYNYILTYSFPCQDLSLAGKTAGMKKGSGTRSGMLWEVERILEECGENLPQILLMENVPQVANKKNKEDFDTWVEFLESKGYTNKWCMLNAKEVGYPEPIPQNRNRCFMVSVLNPKQEIIFPEKTERKLVLKDLLENNVDESYYLSDKQIKSIREWKAYRKPIDDASYLDSETSPTVTAKSNTSMNSSMLLLKDEYKGMFQYSKSDQFMKGKDRFQNDKEVSDCLTTDVKEGVVLIKNATKQGYLEATDGDGIDISSRMQYHRGTVQKESTQTITTKGGENIGVIVQEQYDFSDLD